MQHDTESTNVFDMMKSIYENREKREQDEYDVFGEMVAHNIRNLKSEYSRISVQQQITNLLLDARIFQFPQSNAQSFTLVPSPSPYSAVTTVSSNSTETTITSHKVRNYFPEISYVKLHFTRDVSGQGNQRWHFIAVFIKWVKAGHETLTFLVEDVCGEDIFENSSRISSSAQAVGNDDSYSPAYFIFVEHSIAGHSDRSQRLEGEETYILATALDPFYKLRREVSNAQDT
nr:unnamed protein product [Callosobruchus analis]